MTKIIRASLLLLAVGFSVQSFAALSPVAIAIVPPVEFPPKDFSVTGVRLSLGWGNHRDLYGVDLGLLGNTTEQDFVGAAVSGLFNRTKGQTTILGLQAAALTNLNHNQTNVFGLQVSAFNINLATSSVNGVGLALANIGEHTTVRGAQVGAYNRAQIVQGFQIGIINVCDNLHGIQIGLLNFHRKGLFVVSPLINIGF